MRDGQALVIVLLILALVSAVGLSVISRSVTEVSLSSTQDESSQALSAAEAGIESVLANPGHSIGSTNTIGTGGSYTVVSKNDAPSSPNLALADSLKSGEAVTLFLKGVNETSGAFDGPVYPGGTEFGICWGRFGDVETPPGEAPAVEVTVYYLDGSNVPTVARVNIQANGYASRGDAFVHPPLVNSAGTAYCGATDFYAYRGSINLVSFPTPLFARIRLLYNETTGHPVGVRTSNGSNFLPQGKIIDVAGSAGAATRRVQVIERFPEPLTILDNALYSGNGL